MTIERVRPTDVIDLEVDNSPVYWFWFPFPPNSIDVEVPLTIIDKSGRGAEFYKPKLRRLVDAGSGDKKIGASFKHETVAADRGRSEQNLPMVRPNDSFETTLPIKKLAAAGHYQGTVDVSTPDGVTVTKDFNVYVTHGPLFPVLVIALGVFGSWLLRHWLEIGRPQAFEDLAIARSRDEVLRALPDEEVEFRRAFLERLVEIREANQFDPQTDVAARLQVVTQQLNNFRIISKVLALKGRLNQLVPDPGALIKEFDSLETELRDGKLPVLVKKDDGKYDLVEKARALRKKVFDEARQKMTDGAKELKEAISKAEEDFKKEGLLDEETRNFLVGQLTPITTALDGKVSPLLEDSKTQTDADAVKTLTQARVAYNQAQEAYRKFCVEYFRKIFDRPKPPFPLTGEEWPAFRTKLSALLAGDKFDEARVEFYRRVLTGIHEIAEDKQNTEIAAAAKAAVPENANQLESARSTYSRLVKEIASGVAQKKGVKMGDRAEGKGEVHEVYPPPAGGEDVGDLPSGDPESVRLPDIGSLQRRIRLFDWVALVIVALVSVVVGLKSEWLTRNDFGSMGDYIHVFLWGFGLQAISTIALPTVYSKLGLTSFPAVGAPAGGDEEAGS
jgi:hypothetical protein